jgi:hypothetical protein
VTVFQDPIAPHDLKSIALTEAAVLRWSGYQPSSRQF